MIDSTRFGSITINGRAYESDVIITSEGKVKEAELERSHLVSERDFLSLVFERVDIVVIGTGQSGCVEIPEKVRKFAKDKKIRLIAKPTPEAVERFNELVEAGKRVVAYMHVTC